MAGARAKNMDKGGAGAENDRFRLRNTGLGTSVFLQIQLTPEERSVTEFLSPYLLLALDSPTTKSLA